MKGLEPISPRIEYEWDSLMRFYINTEKIDNSECIYLKVSPDESNIILMDFTLPAFCMNFLEVLIFNGKLAVYSISTIENSLIGLPTFFGSDWDLSNHNGRHLVSNEEFSLGVDPTNFQINFRKAQDHLLVRSCKGLSLTFGKDSILNRINFHNVPRKYIKSIVEKWQK